ncbi:hypothetical protein ACVWZD_005464 [Streptomyces sp. TE3672]
MARDHRNPSGIPGPRRGHDARTESWSRAGRSRPHERPLHPADPGRARPLRGPHRQAGARCSPGRGRPDQPCAHRSGADVGAQGPAYVPVSATSFDGRLLTTIAAAFAGVAASPGRAQWPVALTWYDGPPQTMSGRHAPSHGRVGRCAGSAVCRVSERDRGRAGSHGVKGFGHGQVVGALACSRRPKFRPRPSGAPGPVEFPGCPSAPAPRSSARSVSTVTPGPGCGTACGTGRWKPRSGTTGRSCDSPAATWTCASQSLPIRSPRWSTWRTPGMFCKRRCARFPSRPAPNSGEWWRVWTQSSAAGPCPTHTPTGACGGMANGGTDASTTVNSGGEGLQPGLLLPQLR